METPPTTRPSVVPPRFIVASAVEFNRAGGRTRYGETSQRFYGELIARARAQASNPAAVDAAVSAVEADPASTDAARQLEASFATMQLDAELTGLLEKLLQQMTDRPTAVDLLREIQRWGTANEDINIHVAGNIQGVIAREVHGGVTFN
ncbi:MAG TPA: hypothetical protein PLX89_11900 [Verrucomicrobiota bacterium]|nr:hypothetical protein [Verrucomicrobiales bacterium]HRI13695.1 hypothetical protein [Verrucomicrobiota bacterium]